MKMFDSGEKSFMRMSRMLNYIGTGVLGLMMLLIVVDVLGRYLFNHPVKGSIELVEYLMVIVGSLGLAWCTLMGAHAKIDIVVMGFPKKVQLIIDIITHVLCLVIYVMLVWQGFLEARDMAFLYEDVSTVLEIPVYPFYFLFAFGFLMLCLATIVRLVQMVKEVKS